MPEFHFSSPTNPHFSTLLLSDFIFFCSFILTHPLYFSYIIFFFPYLLKLLSFLSPLFITTFLLLLALLTVSPSFNGDCNSLETSESKVGFLLTTYQTIVHKLQSKLDDDGIEFYLFKELEACIVLVFDSSTFRVEENPVEILQIKQEENQFQSHGDEDLEFSGNQCFNLDVNDIESHNVEELVGISQEKPGLSSPESFLKEKIVSETLTSKGEEQFESISEQLGNINGENPDEMFMGIKSQALCCEVSEDSVKVNLGNGGDYTSEMSENFKVIDSDFESYSSIKKKDDWKEMSNGDKISKVTENPEKLGLNQGFFGSMRKEDNGDCALKTGEKVSLNLRRIGSLRKEKEWKEIDNGEEYTSKIVENSEILGSNLGSFGSMRKEKEWKRTLACKLYEERQNIGEGEGEVERMDLLWEAHEADSGKMKIKNKEKKIKEIENEEEEEEEDEEEEEMNGQLCCLQALRFSTGKMNLGMRRPNLVKISKALKGIGWFHHVSRQSKKN